MSYCLRQVLIQHGHFWGCSLCWWEIVLCYKKRDSFHFFITSTGVFCGSSIYPGIHSCWSLSWLSHSERQDTPWAGLQSQCIVIVANLNLPVNLTDMSGLWEGARLLGRNPRRYVENIQTHHPKSQATGWFKSRTFLLWARLLLVWPN